MKKYIYPAIFQPEQTGGYSVGFPDLPGCITEGENLGDAVTMAKDALGIYLATLEDEGGHIATASHPKSIEVSGDAFVSLVELDMLQYRQKHDRRAVKKTLSIPKWLNVMAEREGINFSSVLQVALKERLGVRTAGKLGQ